MFATHRPTRAAIAAILEAQAANPMVGSWVGCTRSGVRPRGFNWDARSVVLGEGDAVFQRACAALLRWAHFDVGFVELCWPDTPVTPGAQVAVVAHTLGLYSVNVARVMDVADRRPGGVAHLAYAYGTTAHHVERGEERFCVEQHATTGVVTYSIVAVSLPNHPLVWLGYPYARAAQARFAHASLRAMQRAAAA